MSKLKNQEDKADPLLPQNAHSSTYPVSRLAPSFDLVDLAAEIQRADESVNSHVSAKLKVIVDQIHSLQDEAKAVLESARHDQLLHHARCNFKRIPGKIYHLYQAEGEQLYFSMLSPDDWAGKSPHEFVGSYRLEADMSWTPADQIDSQEDTQAIVNRLLQLTSD
jgi:hypothetical protein